MSENVQAPGRGEDKLPDDSREVRLQSGVTLARAGKLEEAATEFNALLAGNSQDTDVLNNLAIVYRLQEKSQDALGALLDAIDIDPTKAEYQYNLGKVYRQLGNFKSAAMACAKAAESDPSLIPAYINLGAAYCLLGEFGKAANFFKKGLDVDPASEILQTNYDSVREAKQLAESSGEPPPKPEITEAADIFMGVPLPNAPFDPAPPVPNAPAEPTATPEAPPTTEPAPSPEPAPSAGPPPTPEPPGAISHSSGPEVRLLTPPYSLTNPLPSIIGLLRYSQKLAAFFPASARRVFSGQGVEQGIEALIAALTQLEADSPPPIPESPAETISQAAKNAAAAAPSPEPADPETPSPTPESPSATEPAPSPEPAPSEGPPPTPKPPGAVSHYSLLTTHYPLSTPSLIKMLTHLEGLVRTLPQTEQRDTLTQKVENIIKGLNAATAATATAATATAATDASDHDEDVNER